ncbi:MAG: hypothetical protein JRH20_26725 [Deltaproteobacteria bacterium]|nr:hypothetical protein [Deltaproteobacteria bacterium]
MKFYGRFLLTFGLALLTPTSSAYATGKRPVNGLSKQERQHYQGLVGTKMRRRVRYLMKVEKSHIPLLDISTLVGGSKAYYPERGEAVLTKLLGSGYTLEQKRGRDGEKRLQIRSVSGNKLIVLKHADRWVQVREKMNDGRERELTLNFDYGSPSAWGTIPRRTMLTGITRTYTSDEGPKQTTDLQRETRWDRGSGTLVIYPWEIKSTSRK